MIERSLAIVGGGPLCTYALERLAAQLPDARFALRVSVFDRDGHLGAGATHTDRQAPTSYLNRVASQIAFGADESNVDAHSLLPRAQRPTFAEWTAARYRATGDARFALHSTNVPHRHLHGVALREAFERYVAILRGLRHVRVDLHSAEVLDLERDADAFRVHVDGAPPWSLLVDHVLLVTGHSNNHAAAGSTAAALAAHAAATPPARYVPFVYPLREQVTDEVAPPGTAVGVLGLGLTAVDLLLHLTEGRGGVFVSAEPATADGAVRYVASGREPRTIVSVSPSGMFTSCRPINHKALDPSGAEHAAREHRGVFLTAPAIRDLRRTVGVPAEVSGIVVRQLDFDRHVFPLIVLEMAYVYYTTLFGAALGPDLRELADAGYRRFLAAGCAELDAGCDALIAPLLARCDNIAAGIAAGAEGSDDARAVFHDVIYGPGGGTSSPWGHSVDPRAHRFDWRALFDPLSSDGVGDWQRRLVAYMHRDHLAAAQGNLHNPLKAACDGVWRDLRSVYSEAVDFGGLTAASHRVFAERHWRHYTRMSNGTGLEAMRKVLALVEAGVVDVSIGPAPVVEPVVGRPSFRLRGGVTSVEREVDVVIEGRCHPFDAERDVHPLYPNLLRRGLTRRWRNPDAGGAFVPGGLDVTRSFHPVQMDGRVERRITILGSPVEGVAYFQLSAARPRSNSSILNMVARWANELCETLGAEVRGDAEEGAP